MKNALLTIPLFLAGFYSQAFPVDGVAVSVSFRSGLNQNYQGSHKPSIVPECNPAEPGWGWGWYYPRGQIVKFTITNTKSVACDTIYRGQRDGLAQYPALSFDGTKVAFFRWGCYVGTSPTSGKDTLLGQSNPAHVSLINIDGTGVRDLITLPANPAFESALDWSADGWIYYTRPRANTLWYWQRESKEIWRVNALNPALNEQLGTYTASDPADTFFHCATWSISAAGSYAMFARSDSLVNVAHNFPLFTSDYARNAASVITGSDGAVSPGGNFVVGFKDSAQTKAIIYKWDHFTQSIAETNPVDFFRISDGAWWRYQAGGPYSGSGSGWIKPRFAVNSEKWVCGQAGWYGYAYLMQSGCNQQIANFVDKQLIQTSENAQNGDQFDETSIRYGNCTGDFWVKPPSGVTEKYEGWDGSWEPVLQPARLVIRHDSVFVKATDTLRFFARAFDSADRPAATLPVITWRISHSQNISPLNQSCLFRAGATNGGPYLLIASAAGYTADTATIVVSATPGMALDRSNWVISASGGFQTAYSNSIDGNAGTCWNTQTGQQIGQWFMVDMSQQHAGVCRMLLQGQHNSDYPRAWAASISTDGISWGNPVATGSANSALTDIQFSAQTCRFVKVAITANGAQTGPFWSICEATMYTNEAREFPVYSNQQPLSKQASILQSKDAVIITVAAPGSHTVMIISARGEIVTRRSGSLASAYRLPTATFANGVYIVKALFNGGSISKKIALGN